LLDKYKFQNIGKEQEVLIKKKKLGKEQEVKISVSETEAN